MSNNKLTDIELAVLQEMVWQAIESLQTDGRDSLDDSAFVVYSNIYAKLGCTPPAPREPQISESERQSAITLADDLIDTARNGGAQDERS